MYSRRPTKLTTRWRSIDVLFGPWLNSCKSQPLHIGIPNKTAAGRRQLYKSIPSTADPRHSVHCFALLGHCGETDLSMFVNLVIADRTTKTAVVNILSQMKTCVIQTSLNVNSAAACQCKEIGTGCQKEWMLDSRTGSQSVGL